MPTTISRINTGDGFAEFEPSKTDSRASAVLTAKSRAPSDDSQMGRVWCASKFTKLPVCTFTIETDATTLRTRQICRVNMRTGRWEGDIGRHTASDLAG